jgi:hypothetical protein
MQRRQIICYIHAKKYVFDGTPSFQQRGSAGCLEVILRSLLEYCRIDVKVNKYRGRKQLNNRILPLHLPEHPISDKSRSILAFISLVLLCFMVLVNISCFRQINVDDCSGSGYQPQKTYRIQCTAHSSVQNNQIRLINARIDQV